ncbi:hypothetical protein KKF25_03340, partial [Patescibacteria group bacterium]|nr:hypothetical protein [Patescibacteria group bacterium]
DIVEKEADLKGYLLRPLSAKLLESTLVEQKGLVEREKLLAISGRSRKTQIALAKKYGIKEYPTPAGGCALTQKDFASRLKELMVNKPDFTPEDVDLVAVGRHFWLDSETLPFDKLKVNLAQGILPERSEAKSKAFIQIILGRNQEENELLAGVAKKGDLLVMPDGFVGPTALVRGGEKATERAKELILQFSAKAKDLKAEEIRFKITMVD